MNKTAHQNNLRKLEPSEKGGKSCKANEQHPGICKRKVKYEYNYPPDPERAGYYCIDHFPIHLP